MEWTGITRSYRNKGRYWAITDDGDPALRPDEQVASRDRLYLINEDGSVFADFPVLSPAGADTRNHDWHDIHADGFGNIWILENVEADSPYHMIYGLKEPDKVIRARQIERILTYGDEGPQEALFGAGSRLFVVPPRTRRVHIRDRIRGRIPQHVLEIRKEAQMIGGVSSAGTIHTEWHYCTGADYLPRENVNREILCKVEVDEMADHVDGLLALNSNSGTWVMNWPHCSWKHKIRTNRSSGGGICFTHDHKALLMQIESGRLVRHELDTAILTP